MPAAIVLVNNDLTPNVQNMLVRQLHITEVIDGYTFDARVSANPNYLTQVHNFQQRLMIIRSLVMPVPNANLVDIIMFVKAGLANVVLNNITGTSIKKADLCRGDDDDDGEGFYRRGKPFQAQPQPQDPNSVQTAHHLYPDQLFGMQFRNLEFQPSLFDLRGPGAMTLPVVNISWGALGVY